MCTVLNCLGLGFPVVFGQHTKSEVSVFIPTPFALALVSSPQSPQFPLGSSMRLQDYSFLNAPATLFLHFAPSSLDVASNLAVGFLNRAHTSVTSPFILVRNVCLLFPTKTRADTKTSL